jgi:hypothetical protein
MRDETVHPRADVYVLGRPVQENLSRGPKILVEVVRFDESRARMTVGQDRECISEP